ncbi:MAG: hypothetical protein WC770_05520 [Phycisphaerae bacterium]
MRIRIIAALVIGGWMLGFLPWDGIKPDAAGVFSLLTGNISIQDILGCAVLAFAAGFAASAVCTPYGEQIGIIAAPAGMAVWALKSAPISKLFQAAPSVQSRLEVYSKLKFEGFIWLALAACGFVGAIAADKIFRRKPVDLPDNFKPVYKIPEFAQIAIAVIATVFIANIVINALALGVGFPDLQLKNVVAQPANGQIAFAAMLAFCLCGFLAKLFLSSKAVWPAIASSVITYYFTVSYVKSGTLTQLAASWPAVFFYKPIMAVLPVQMVSFACLGAVWGYWLAVRYHVWRTEQK